MEINKKLITTKTTTLKTTRGTLFISHSNIVALKKCDSYTKIYLNDGSIESASNTLNHFAEKLKNVHFFFKPHPSYLINLEHLKEFSTKEKGHLIVTTNLIIPIAKERRDEFMKLIDQFFYL